MQRSAHATIPKWDRNELEGDWSGLDMQSTIKATQIARVKCDRSEIEWKWNWYRIVVKVASNLKQRSCDMKLKCFQSEIVTMAKWHRSWIGVKLKWHRSEVEVSLLSPKTVCLAGLSQWHMAVLQIPFLLYKLYGLYILYTRFIVRCLSYSAFYTYTYCAYLLCISWGFAHAAGPFGSGRLLGCWPGGLAIFWSARWLVRFCCLVFVLLIHSVGGYAGSLVSGCFPHAFFLVFYALDNYALLWDFGSDRLDGLMVW